MRERDRENGYERERERERELRVCIEGAYIRASEESVCVHVPTLVGRRERKKMYNVWSSVCDLV